MANRCAIRNDYIEVNRRKDTAMTIYLQQYIIEEFGKGFWNDILCDDLNGRPVADWLSDHGDEIFKETIDLISKKSEVSVNGEISSFLAKQLSILLTKWETSQILF